MNSLALKRKQWRRRHHVAISVAVVLATVMHYVSEAFAPSLSPLAPLVGLGANLIWIWAD
jgi:hypothetical protein